MSEIRKKKQEITKHGYLAKLNVLRVKKPVLRYIECSTEILIFIASFSMDDPENFIRTALNGRHDAT